MCIYACKSPFGFTGRTQPCAECKAEYDAWMDRSYAEYCLEKQARAVHVILPATDREYQEHLDQVTPVVDVIRINDSLIVESE